MPPTEPGNFSDSFATTHLPVINKDVFRMGIAGNYGLDSSDVRWAAERGANYWVWGTSFKKVTEGLKELVQADRAKHIIAMLGWGFWGHQIRRSVESALQQLNTDYLDVFKLGWLGRTSAYTTGTIDTLLQLKEEGKIRAIGVSIHDRRRAGRLAADSVIDLFMIRYNAKHPGAEEDIFPYLSRRNPAIVSYTALAWTQLTQPIKGLEIEPWPAAEGYDVPPLTPELCYRFILTNSNVHLVLTGPKNREQLSQNLKALEKGPLTDEELSWVRKYGQLVRTKKRFDFF